MANDDTSVSTAPLSSFPSPYDVGQTPSVACAYDQRFSYCLYVPKAGNPETRRIFVAVHGTGRGNQVMRNRFIDLAEKLNLIVLAPLFPCGIDEADDRDNYKYIEYRGIRFDLVLLAMIDEVAAKYRVPAEPFSLIGFSGGAHFAHRLLYLHPQRLSAVSICAPGSPTMPDLGKPWWVGVADMEQRFGRPFSIEAMRRVRVHLAVGEADTETWEITHRPGSKHWMEGANDSGRTRVERLAALYGALTEIGIDTRIDYLPGVAHEFDPIADRAETFFDEVLGQPVSEA